MSNTILSGDLTVYWKDENRRKQIKWTGGTGKTDVQKMIDVYDACEDLLTQPEHQTKGLIFSAETPGEYTIGLSTDTGQLDPWFIDMKSMEHFIGDFANFTGCALKTTVGQGCKVVIQGLSLCQSQLLPTTSSLATLGWILPMLTVTLGLCWMLL